MDKHPKYPKRIGSLGNEDSYLNDEGFTVFTEHYHRKRGYCCKNACRHCPYGYKIDMNIKKNK